MAISPLYESSPAALKARSVFEYANSLLKRELTNQVAGQPRETSDNNSEQQTPQSLVQ